MIFHHAHPCKYKGIEGKRIKITAWTNLTTLWEPNGLMLNRWAVYDHIYSISLGMRRECRCLWVVGAGATALCSDVISFACLSLIVISANRNREAHQQAVPGLVRLMWMIKLVLAGRGAFPLLDKSTNWTNIDSAVKISVCWKKYYS